MHHFDFARSLPTEELDNARLVVRHFGEIAEPPTAARILLRFPYMARVLDALQTVTNADHEFTSIAMDHAACQIVRAFRSVAPQAELPAPDERSTHFGRGGASREQSNGH